MQRYPQDKALVAFTQSMAISGIRRLLVLSGNQDFHQQILTDWQRCLAGRWLIISDSYDCSTEVYAPASYRTLLGQECQHGFFDASQGFHAEAFAALSGTIIAGGWLLLALPPIEQWEERPDRDSLRWINEVQPIATPHFMATLRQSLIEDPESLIWYQDHPLRLAQPKARLGWLHNPYQQQHQLLQQLLPLTEGITVITAARGRGKSALAGMLVAKKAGCIVTAPAKVSIRVLAEFAGEHLTFIAPDALLAAESPPPGQCLIIDEAAALPTSVLEALITRYPLSILMTTVQGYEGTGRGFMLKFLPRLASYQHLTLTQPLRFAENDPLERITAKLLCLDLPQNDLKPSGKPITRHPLSQSIWRHQPQEARQFYQLLVEAHYRTTPLDLRRFMDAPAMKYWCGRDQGQICAALWAVREGGLEPSLSQAIWEGRRRPKGNLVAQSLAAHGNYPHAAQLHSVRISRLAVAEQWRRRGLASQLVRQMITDCSKADYISVSFGYSPVLSQFWQRCGFKLVRIGTQKEASSGLVAAMALYPISEAGQQLCEDAHRNLQRDWPLLFDFGLTDAEPDNLGLGKPDLSPDVGDWQQVAGFAHHLRPFSASFPALYRIWTHYGNREHYPLLQHYLSQSQLREAGSRKDRLRALRQQTATWLKALEASPITQLAERAR